MYIHAERYSHVHTNKVQSKSRDQEIWAPETTGGVASPLPECTVCREFKEADTCSA